MATALDKQLSGYNDIALLVGRILLGALLLIAAYGKVRGYAGTTGYFGRLGLPAPGAMAALVAAFEAIAGVLLIIGWQTRLGALAVAAFCIVAALIAHTNFGDANQLNHFLKNFAVAGGALALFVAGPGAYSLDARK
jgi:putative oxidoreductase